MKVECPKCKIKLIRETPVTEICGNCETEQTYVEVKEKAPKLGAKKNGLSKASKSKVNTKPRRRV